MLKNIFKLLIVGISLSFIVGCAPNNVSLNQAFWKNKNDKITVVSARAPKPKVHNVGGQGFVDLAVTKIANNKFINAVAQTEIDWYETFQQKFINRLKSKQKQVTLYTQKLNLNQKDHARILAETKSDLLLTFKLKAIGARREYSGFIPLGKPEGYCVLVGELINPKENKVLWRHEAEVIQSVNGSWDQPPYFQNFNTALNLAVADAEQEILDSFFNGE